MMVFLNERSLWFFVLTMSTPGWIISNSDGLYGDSKSRLLSYRLLTSVQQWFRVLLVIRLEVFRPFTTKMLLHIYVSHICLSARR